MRYSKPEIEVITLNVTDIITTSVTTNPGENQLPVVPRPVDADI